MENLEEIKKSFDTAQDREIELIKERNKRVCFKTRHFAPRRDEGTH